MLTFHFNIPPRRGASACIIFQTVYNQVSQTVSVWRDENGYDTYRPYRDLDESESRQCPLSPLHGYLRESLLARELSHKIPVPFHSPRRDPKVKWPLLSHDSQYSSWLFPICLQLWPTLLTRPHHYRLSPTAKNSRDILLIEPLRRDICFALV